MQEIKDQPDETQTGVSTQETPKAAEAQPAAQPTPQEEEKPKKKKKPHEEHDMNDDNFDYVVLGTNLSENILGA